MNKKKHIKKRRQQPAPKKKKKVAGSYRQKEVSLEDKLKAYGMQMAEAFKYKDSINGIRGTGTFIHTFGTIYSLKNRYPCVA